jgi:hypothetical protein
VVQIQFKKILRKKILPEKIPPERDTLIYPQAKRLSLLLFFIEWTQNAKLFYWR